MATLEPKGHGEVRHKSNPAKDRWGHGGTSQVVLLLFRTQYGCCDDFATKYLLLFYLTKIVVL